MSDEQSAIRSWWRIIVLVILVCASLTFLFGLGPAGADAPTNETQAVEDGSSMTELSYGLDLAGGTRIRAPLIGLTAEDASVSTTDTASLERSISNQLDDASPTDVSVYPRADSEEDSVVEVTAENTSREEFEQALEAEDITFEEVRPGVSTETREETVTVLEDKINQDGLSGGSVREVSSASGEHFILIEVPDQRRDEVRDVISQRGVVSIDIYHPTEEGYETREAVLERDDFQQIGMSKTTEQLGPHVPVVLTPDAAADFEQETGETGFLPGGSRCSYEAAPEQSESCLLTLVDGEVVYSAGMSSSLASNIDSGNWENEGSFVLQTSNYSEASDLALHLRAGALPATLDIDNGTSTYISPTQGEHFKMSSLIIGLLATLAVSLKVFYRYRDVRVAAPMVGVALTEVVILLGVAALLQYPIDLAVVGGFVAVIGTGVDDLIIIANEVLAKGDVNSSRVFRSRFKKAFWVIMSAALTTIIAMSPLVFLSLGDLRGFAIFTIIGVIVGVAVTRPAYGDLLEKLLIE